MSSSAIASPSPPSPSSASTRSHETILRRLLSSQEVTPDEFNAVADDIIDHDNLVPSAHFRREWDDLIEQVGSTSKQAHGSASSSAKECFQMKYIFSSASSSSSSDPPESIDTSSLPAKYQTQSAKAHIQSICSLLHTTTSQALDWTEQVLRSHHLASNEEDKVAYNPDHPQNNDINLLGTRTLLMNVRDWYWSNQIARIRIVAEALRRERCNIAEQNDSDTANNAEVDARIVTNCAQFLNQLDEKVTLVKSGSSSNSDRSVKRGLFQWLLGLSTSTSPTLGRRELHPTSLLSTLHKDSSTSPNDAEIWNDLSMEDYYKLIIDQSALYHEKVLRTEALEALFALLYEKVEVQRMDYMMILMGFQRQSFFVSSLSSHFDKVSRKTIDVDRKLYTDYVNGISPQTVNGFERQSQLSALILAECMCLWRTSMPALDDKNSDDECSPDHWVSDHPFLHGDDPEQVEHELIFIGKSILLSKLSFQVMQRRGEWIEAIQEQEHRKHSSNGTVMSTNSRQLEDIDIPESIAILTFGLLMKMVHQCGSTLQSRNCSRVIGPSIKELGVECVSVANGDCGSFEYLHRLLQELFPPSYSNHILEYASIGREILNTTLSAFRNTLLCQVTKSKESNIGLMCHMASTIYRKKDSLCEFFWDHWDDYCKSRQGPTLEIVHDSRHCSDLSTYHTNRTATDASCQLLEVAYVMARNTACSERSNLSSAQRGTSWGQRKSIEHLSSLLPFVSFLSSLVPKVNMISSTLEAFTEMDTICHLSLLGCLDLACMNVSTFMHNHEDMELLRINEDNARQLVSSLCLLVQLAEENDASAPVLHLLRSLFGPSQFGGHQLSGPRLLYLISTKVTCNLDLAESTRSTLCSSCLYMLGSLLPREDEEDDEWVTLSLDLLGGGETGRGGFVQFTLGSIEITASAMFLLDKMTTNVCNFAVLEGSNEHDIVRYLNVVGDGAMTACEILSSMTACFTPSSLRLNIVSRSLSVIRNLIQCLHLIVEHKSDLVRTTAHARLRGLLQILSTSTLIGASIGHFATLPVTLGLIDHLHENEASSRKEYDIKTESMTLDIAHDALVLLLLWGDLVEQFAMERTMSATAYKHMNIAILDDIGNMNQEDRIMVGEELRQHGPLRLLLSTPLKTNVSTPFSSDTSILKLLHRYICVASIDSCTHRDSQTKRIRHALANQAIASTRLCITHSNLAGNGRSFQIDNGHAHMALDECIDGQIGSILHEFLLNGMEGLSGLSSDDVSCVTGQDKFAMLLQIMDLIKTSIRFYPRLLSVLFADGDVSKIPVVLSLMVKTLNIPRPITLRECLLASSCMELLCEMYCLRTTRNMSKADSSDRIIANLTSYGPLLDNCAMIVRDHRSLVQKVNTIIDHKAEGRLYLDRLPTNTYKLAAVFSLISQSLALLTHESLFHLCDEKDANLMKTVELSALYETMISLDGTQQAGNLNHVTMSTIQNLHTQLECEVAMYDPIPMFIDRLCFHKGGMKSNLVHISTALHSAKLLRIKQTRLFSASCDFIETILVKDHLVESSGFNMQKEISVETDTDLVRMSMDALMRYADNFFVTHVNTSQAKNLCQVVEGISTGCKLVRILLLHIQQYSAANSIQQGTTLLDLIGRLQRVTKQFNIIILQEQSHSTKDLRHLSCKLRLDATVSALVLMKEVDTTDFDIKEQAHYNSIRTEFCQSVCESLSLLSVSSDSSRVDQLPYDFGSSDQDSDKMSLQLLRVSLSLLLLVIPQNDSSIAPTSSDEEYESDLAATLRISNAISLLYRHNQYASEVASMAHHSGKRYLESVDIVMKVQSVFFSMANSSAVIATILLDHDYVGSISKSLLLSKLFQSWSSTRNFTSRGYISNNDFQVSTKASMWSYAALHDVEHDIWRSILQTMAALLQTFRYQSEFAGGIDRNEEEESAFQLCISTIFDFLQTFDEQLSSCLRAFSAMKLRSSQSDRTGLTINFLREASDIMSLLLELSGDNYRQVFEKSSPQAYLKFMALTFDTVKSLSTFLGSVGTAREVFSALQSLNSATRESDGNTDQLSTAQVHPLLVDGEYNAEHEAIKNALYANSYCTCMTGKEYALFQSKTSSSLSKHETQSDSQQFYELVNNEYILLFETIAGTTVFNALAVIEKTYPFMQTTLMTSNDDESMLLRLSTTPSTVTTRGSLFQFHPAPITITEHESSAATRSNKSCSVGNLILLLRWCHQHSTIPSSIPATLVKAIAECASLLLCNEVSLYNDGDLNEQVERRNEDDAKKVNKQLLDLFDDAGIDSARNHDKVTADYKGLKSIMDDEVHSYTLKRIESSLSSAKTEKEKLRLISEQSGTVNHLGWTHSVHQIGRRSPFKRSVSR